MKIKSIEILQQKLDEDSVWRKKELSIIFGRIATQKNPKLRTEIRVGVVMLYAHWEGFVKHSFELYFSYLSNIRLKYEDLNNNFISIEVENIIQESKGKMSNRCNDVVSFILNDLKRKVNFKQNIDTKSNLNFELLSDILFKAGIDYEKYSLKAKLIDEKLVSNRNSIAHGNYVSLDKQDFENLYFQILDLIESIKNEILNSCSLKSYIK